MDKHGSETVEAFTQWIMRMPHTHTQAHLHTYTPDSRYCIDGNQNDCNKTISCEDENIKLNFVSKLCYFNAILVFPHRRCAWQNHHGAVYRLKSHVSLLLPATGNSRSSTQAQYTHSRGSSTSE